MQQEDQESEYQVYGGMLSQAKPKPMAKDPATAGYEYLCGQGYDAAFIQAGVRVMCVKI
jgi:hypothetical protein